MKTADWIFVKISPDICLWSRNSPVNLEGQSDWISGSGLQMHMPELNRIQLAESALSAGFLVVKMYWVMVVVNVNVYIATVTKSLMCWARQTKARFLGAVHGGRPARSSRQWRPAQWMLGGQQWIANVVAPPSLAVWPTWVQWHYQSIRGCHHHCHHDHWLYLAFRRKLKTHLFQQSYPDIVVWLAP